MKRKNLKSVIHNFAHSFQAVDYRISQYPLLIELCSLYKEQGITSIEVDMLTKVVKPELARKQGIIERIQDYADWLPELCRSQEVNPAIIKELCLAVTAAFDSATVYRSSRNERVVQIETIYSCRDDLGNILEGRIVENEVVKKQSFQNC